MIPHFPARPRALWTTALLVLSAFLGLVAFAFSVAHERNRLQQAKQLQTLVCVVSGQEASELTVDAVVIIEDKKYKAPFPESDEKAQTTFQNEYFKPGQEYRVTFGGGELAVATIKSAQIGCNSLHATAVGDTGGKLQGQVMGLATNSVALGRTVSARRAPTIAERATVMRLVQKIYQSRKTPTAWLRLLTTTNLTATDLNSDGQFELIGSFVIQTTTKMRRDLLLIAEPAGKSYEPTLVAFQAYRLPPEQFDSAADFVDQLDLDGDGFGEVFVVEHGFDAYSYSIYKKVNGRWKKIHSAIGDAC